VPGADAGDLSLGAEPRCLAALRRRLRLLLDRHLGLGPDLAAGTVSDADPWHGNRVLLQRAALYLLDRPADRRDPDCQPRRVRTGGDNHRNVVPARADRRAVYAGDQRQATATRAVAGGHRANGKRRLRCRLTRVAGALP